MAIPQIQIRQQRAQLGFDADLGTQRLRQPKADLQIRTEPAKVQIRSPRGELKIDQSKAWDALGLGSHLEVMRRIRAQAHQAAMQGIARIVENGNRLSAIHTGTNAIAEIARESMNLEFFEFQYAGQPSVDNVDIFYTARKPIIDVIDGVTDIRVTPRPPEHEYVRGKFDAHMIRYPKVEIIPPQIDVRV